MCLQNRPGAQVMGSWQALFFCVFQSNGGKREATRSASQARGGAKCESSARRREVRVKRKAARRKTRAKPLLTSSCQQTRGDKLLEANIRSFSALLKLAPLVCALTWWLHFESEVFLVFTHVTFVLTTVAIHHVSAQTNSYTCASSKVRVRKQKWFFV